MKFLYSFHGIQTRPISVIEGVLVDLVLSIPVKNSSAKVAAAGGLSASSNVLVLWFLLLQGLSPLVIAFMWILSLISGVTVGLFGEYASKRVSSMIGVNLPM